jgi:zinc transport system permease protein
MTLLDYLTDWSQAWPLVVRPLLIGGALTIMSALLSVLVVLKRLSFAGQGISHSAFGGIGLAAIVSVLIAIATGAHGGNQVGVGAGGLVEFAIVLIFCTATALAMAAVADRKAIHIDTGIGLLLVAAMALGGVLVDVSRQLAAAHGLSSTARSWESVLFGSVLVTSNQDLLIAVSVLILIAGSLWWWRRPLLFWTFDEQSAPAFGVPAKRIRTLLMVLLSIVVVTSMKLAGVVPATALLVLPGAIALRLSQRLGTVLFLACVSGCIGLVVAMALALQFNLQPGPCIVLVLTIAYFAAALRSPHAQRNQGRAAPGRA